MKDGTIRWGILGTGDVCRQFVSDLNAVPSAEPYSVASRSTARARRFARKYRVPRYHGTYAGLAQDPEVDVVYVGTPHVFHHGDVILCLESGKHVVCEKPLATSLADGVEMVEAARGSGRFLMEAMWTLFFPAMRQVRDWIASGAIGEPRLVRADMNHAAPFSPTSRLYDPKLGGGALFDLGVYPLALGLAAFGCRPGEGPAVHYAWKRDGFTGVDVQNAALLEYPGGGMLQFTSGLDVDAPQTAVIAGSEGYIQIPHSFSQPDNATLSRKGQREDCTFQREGYGYHYEAAHVTQCLLEGKQESDIMPHDASLALLRVLDQLRETWRGETAGQTKRGIKGDLALWR